MNRPSSFERVYAAIKLRLRQGVYRPGDRLEPASLATGLMTSATPVRDALQRLTGERLVEAPRHEGFRSPVLTETMLRHLYAWHRDLLLLAIVNRPRRGALAGTEQNPDSTTSGLLDRQNAMFLSLAQMTGNPEHVIALENLMERLEPAQRLEGLLLSAVEEESEDISAAIRSPDKRQLRRTLVHYHRRRAMIVPELLDRLRNS